MVATQNMTLCCVRNDGKREQVKLAHQTLGDARELAISVLQAGNGLYTQVDICTEDGTTETIPNPDVPTPPGKS